MTIGLITPKIRFCGELNNIKYDYIIRERVLYYMQKHDELEDVKKEFSKGEYHVLINELGKAMVSVTRGIVPIEYHIHSYWINHLNILKSIEKIHHSDILSIYYMNDEGERKRGLAEYRENVSLNDIYTIEERTILKLTCRVLSASSIEHGFNVKYQYVVLFDDNSPKTTKGILYNNYVDDYKWRYNRKVELLGVVIDKDSNSDVFPSFHILSMVCVDENSDRLKEEIELDKSKRDSPAYNYWKNEVLTRDKCCQCCNSTNSLEAHHIFGYKFYLYGRLDVDNGIVLCEKCHKKYHREYGKKATPINLVKFLQKYSVNNVEWIGGFSQ